MIKPGSQVKLHYTLTVDQEIVDTSRKGEPLSYVHGQGQIIPGLEKQLEGLGEGARKTLVVQPEDGYGMPDASAVHTLPKTAFTEPERLQVGDTVAGQAQGQSFQARVVAVQPNEITLDLNHPLAGKTLHFAVEVVEVG